MEKEVLVNVADLIASMAHRGQVDKAGEPYINHPRAVASKVETAEEKIVALLHDTLEDTYLTEDVLSPVFGENIMDAVVTMTRAKGEDYFQYIGRISENELALNVKMADLTHNMDLSRLSNPTEKDYERIEKYKKAYAILENKKEEY